ncbi:hypothetical protein CTEN210_13213 [Chaetoceros tenuissimus]|uniref:Uncharacterized protein n=1 Tax=Chaetoceros tenuissimus TaxID=426638 RepID=A0AAD3D387_9STRA|nr:hypothetical protein CTEN210_13213 [Chaetoceros tenuissimus]
MSEKEATEAATPAAAVEKKAWTNEDLISLIQAVKFSNKEASQRQVHTEITTVMSKTSSFEFLSDITLNDVKKVWKKALTQKKASSEAKDVLPSTGGILKFYTVGDGSVKTLAEQYTNKAAAALVATEEKEEEEEMKHYVHVFLNVPADKSGTKPHQALINFQKKSKGKGKKASDGKEIVKIQSAGVIPGMEDVKNPMLLYNQSRTARTFIHPDENGEDDEGYDKIKALIEEAGKSGVVTGGGLKAYFYAKISKRPGEQDVISIDVKELAPAQAW